MPVTLTGFSEYVAKLNGAAKSIQSRIDAEVRDAAMEWAERAINSAPANFGILRGKIHAAQKGKTWEVICQSAYAAYMEWGTGSKVQIPADLQGYASQFKGKAGGGNIDEFFLNILEWVKHKGITGNKSTGNKRSFDDYDAAFLIMMKILKVGVRPHPFFFIHKAAIELKLINSLKTMVKEL